MKKTESFIEIRDGATRLATELMTKLERLKVKEDLRGHQRAWASLFKAVESAWTRDELHEMRLKLKTLKEAMESRLLFSLRSVLYHLFYSCRSGLLTLPAKNLISWLSRCLKDSMLWIDKVNTSFQHSSRNARYQRIDFHAMLLIRLQPSASCLAG